MHRLNELYRPSLSLLTDLYQLTMAYGYWKNGLAEREAVFHLFFRKNPFDGGYAIACGLQMAVEYLEQLRFDSQDLSYLATLTGADNQPLFEDAFLDYLGELHWTCDVDAIPEGTVVYPHEPLVRVQGPILQCQLVETPLLNLINFQTLVATKAARVCSAAGVFLPHAADRVIEFGLRRAQGIDGALSASRAAFIGGCAATSNVMAGRLYGIPVVGTHAHSWVMTFASEREAFELYADAMPNNCVFLVDTYDTLEGVRKAVEVGHRLRATGHEMLGIRLDSGDLAWLSIEARKILDEAGFPDASIVASNDLDERLITSLKRQGARIDTWGVGTKLATAFDQPALGGVYKLGAIRDENGTWQPRIKLSEQTIKVSNPGILQVRRFERESGPVSEHRGDMIFDEQTKWDQSHDVTMVDPADHHRQKTFAKDTPYTDLLQPVFRNGEIVGESPSLQAIRDRVRDQLSRTPMAVQRFENPHEYPVGLEQGLFHLKADMIHAARERT
ncbi:nicotinate phosphoribosyltransferase [Allorhodopirellula heiligendammensis]|uniref:Nicotinate phosphoribosyltransferase n=1 Tax=Allorhodopirellula heiligendammensis TaxID=2714739 RepID=A0A5C6BFN2_9BACT|nr:nicotinate phosphoribosyltransferase [Allorhodopirellula heiligendammensis]TWU10953.1 Nicotinate phosphoribosyltransferase pncB2 [Allorhodopirellula heiligendammensis]